MNDIPEIVPITELRNNIKSCSDIIASGKDIILTKNGYGSVIMMNLDKYSQLIQDMQLQKAVIAGEQQIAEGKTRTWASAKESLRKAIENA